LSRDSDEVIRSARDVRKALVRVIDMLGARKREVLRINDEGIETYDMEKLTIEDRKQQLYKAMTWLNSAENEMRQTRGLLERAIERAERRIG
jgi:hypothetical protein